MKFLDHKHLVSVTLGLKGLNSIEIEEGNVITDRRNTQRLILQNELKMFSSKQEIEIRRTKQQNNNAKGTFLL